MHVLIILAIVFALVTQYEISSTLLDIRSELRKLNRK